MYIICMYMCITYQTFRDALLARLHVYLHMQEVYIRICIYLLSCTYLLLYSKRIKKRETKEEKKKKNCVLKASSVS